MSDIQYPYALDESGNLVCIDNVQKETRYNHSYSCPCCGNDMEPRLGDHNAHCFAHASGKRCGKESYLHYTAKKILERRFRDGTLTVKLFREYECKKHCEHFIRGVCSGRSKKTYLLSELYDTVVIEKDINKNDEVFRPDVMISDSNSKLSPILLEVCNTSPCSTRKMENCKNIIEIKIKEFSDLVDLQKKTIEESEESFDLRKKKNVACYNFKILKLPPEQLHKDFLDYTSIPEDYTPYCFLTKSQKRRRSSLWKMYWYGNGKYYLNQIFDDEIELHRDKAVFEVTIKFPYYNYPGIKASFFSVICIEYPELRLCRNCSLVSGDNYGEHWCKYNGSTRKQTFNEQKAANCRYYQHINVSLINSNKPVVVQFWCNPNIDERPSINIEWINRYQNRQE